MHLHKIHIFLVPMSTRTLTGASPGNKKTPQSLTGRVFH